MHRSFQGPRYRESTARAISAAAILTRIDCSRLKHILAAHLSHENNRPELAVRALAGALSCAESWVGVSTQDEGFAWREV